MFFPIIIQKTSPKGILITEWILDPIQLKIAIKEILEASWPIRKTK